MSTLTDEVSSFINAVIPVIEAVVPETAPAIAIGAKIVQGLLAAEPTAVALYNQIKTGTAVTDAQLAQFAADYEDAYQRLNADIAAKLAAG